MLYHAGLMLEYIAIIVTLQRIYNRKVCLNIDSVGLCLMSLTIVELVRYYGLSNLFTIIIYILIGIYCVRKYNDSVIGSIVSVLLLLIVIVVLQYIAIFPCSYFFSNNLEFFSPHAIIASMMGISVIPNGVIAYSERGGSSG